MHARSLLLLRRDWHQIQQETGSAPSGVRLRPGESLLEWSADVEGLSGSSYEGGVFQVQI
jgi:ubiquitin-protein ligase